MTDGQFIESRQEMEDILREEVMGYLGLSMDGKPYVVPLNHGYIDGKILFHCALTGKKLDYLRANPEVCYTVGRQSGEVRRHDEGFPCHLDTESVICYGRARIVEDVEERKHLLDIFSRTFQSDAEEVSLEAAANCYAIEVQISEMTGRREQERKCTYWQYMFET